MTPFEKAFAELVRRKGSPHAAKRPTHSFTVVLAALDELSSGSSAQIARHAGLRYWREADDVLQRLDRYGCVTLTRGEPDPYRGNHRPKLWTITEAGRELAWHLRRPS